MMSREIWATLEPCRKECSIPLLPEQVYVEAFETIVMIEKTFGTQLREYAIRISKERYEVRREGMEEGFRTADQLSRTR